MLSVSSCLPGDPWTFWQKLLYVFLVTAGEGRHLGELCTQLEILSIQRVLSFP